MEQADEDQGEGEAEAQGLGHGAGAGLQEVKEEQQRSQEHALSQEGAGGRPAQGEQEELVRVDPQVAQKDQKAEKAEKIRVPGGEIDQGGQGGE